MSKIMKFILITMKNLNEDDTLINNYKVYKEIKQLLSKKIREIKLCSTFNKESVKRIIQTAHLLEHKDIYYKALFNHKKTMLKIYIVF